jgi:hypothetical protein
MDTDDEPVGYMERTRLYYRALGYDNDYAWSHYDDVPFARPAKPLAEARIGLVTTSSPMDRSNRDSKGVKHVWSGETAAPPRKLYTLDLAWDKESTHTDDRESFLPVEALQGLAAEGRFAGLTAHFHGVPTAYSQRQTIEEDAPRLLGLLRDERADGVILLPI